MKTIYTSLIFLIFLGCQEPTQKQVESVPVEPALDYYEMGKEISAIAQMELMKSVQTGLKKGGPTYAVEHCDIHATPLSDSLSEHFNCKIQRISSKNRGLDNAPASTQESLLLNAYLESSLDGLDLKDTLISSAGKTIYYRPIMIGMEACLKCHGQIKKDISDETLTAIYTLYPNDKATNYRLGEFRGAWKISFPVEP